MSLFRKSVGAFALVTLFISSTAAQTCYFPDGSESGHTACSSGSQASCCGESDVCMTNGLCFGDGLMSRGSCTDKDWKSEECSQYCSDVSTNTSIPVMACTNDGEDSEFICGMNTANCKKSSAIFKLSSSDLTFRPSELEAIVNPAVSSAVSSALAQATTQAAAQTKVTVTALPTSSNSDATYTAGEMAGLGVGLGVPLLIASCLALLLWKKDRDRTPKLMYPLPDDLADPYTSKDGRPLHPAMAATRPPASRDGSVMSFNTMKSGTPAHLQTFAERYQVMKGTQGFHLQRVELDASPAVGDYDGDHELHDLKVPLPKEF